jgi:hypothetical protein
VGTDFNVKRLAWAAQAAQYHGLCFPGSVEGRLPFDA